MKILEMNRKNIGFIVKMSDHFVSDDNGVIVFDNLELVKMYMINYMNTIFRDYSVYIMVDDVYIPLDSAQKISDYYEFYVDGEKYRAIENLTRRVIYIGYFIFENGDCERTLDSKIGNNKQKDFMNIIKSTITNYMIHNNGIVESIKLDDPECGNYRVTFKNSTLNLHLCFNNKVMKINQTRKENGLKCIPFDKDMDKFTTIYVYATKNNHEPVSYGSLGIAKNIIYTIAENLVNERYDLNPKFTNVDFHGNVFI